MNISSRQIFPIVAAALILPFAQPGFAQAPAQPEAPTVTAEPPLPPGTPSPGAEPSTSVAATEIPRADESNTEPVDGEAARPAEAGSDGERPKLRRIDEIVPAAPEPPSPENGRDRRVRGGNAEFPFGDQTVPAGTRVREMVAVLGSVTIEGQVDSDAGSVLGSTYIAPGGRVGNAAMAVLGSLESHGEVGGEAVGVLGSVLINGPVGGDAVSVLGSMELGRNAVVGGDLVVVGGSLTRHPDAIVRGSEVGMPGLGSFGDMEWFTSWLHRCVYYGRPLAFGPDLGWAWAIAFSFFALYLFIALLAPRGITRCVEVLETRPGYSILSAVLTVMLTPVAIVLLTITVIGALLVPFLGAGLMFAALLGKAVMLAWIGRRITKLFGDRLGHPFFAVLIGGLIVLLLYTVPVLGFLSFKLLSWLGLGVVVYTIALAISRETSPGSRLPAPLPSVAPAYPTSPHPGSPPVPPTAPVPPPVESSGVTTPPAMSAGFSEPTTSAVEASGVPESGPAPAPPSTGDVGVQAAPLPPPSWVPPPQFAPPPPAAIPPLTPVVGWPRAGFFIRLGALAIDGILIGLILAFISGLLPRFLELNDGPGGWLVALAIYGAIMWKHKGTTIGGIVCGLKVVRTDNRELDWPTAVVRALACFLSLAVAGLGFIWIAIDEDKQSWHDKIAGTVVVLVPKGASLV